MNQKLTASVRPKLRRIQRMGYFILGTILTIFYAEVVQAQTNTTTTQNPYSIETIIAIVVAAVLTVLYLKGMYQVLTYASETYGLADDEENDLNKEENNALLYGALAWVFGSALVIASYGWGWAFLYTGPIICLLGPVVPIVAMNLDLQRYKEILLAATHSWRNS